MTERCPTAFDEKLISGHLDGELTQAADQKVRLHLESCTHCRGTFNELQTIREAAMTTKFIEPTDDQWDERPRGVPSRVSRSVGWALAVVWLAAVSCFGLWQLWRAPEGLLEKVLIFGGVAAFGLVFLSALLDRIRTARSDRYREVEK
jgi:predicted anti-sigma-YlaC factor YlaD